MTTQRSLPHRGFTLLEMVLVLVILAVLATVAVQTMEPQIDQKRFEATQQVIRNVDQAILARDRGTNGELTLHGFFVDLGGLPRGMALLDANGRAVYTLGELWIPSGQWSQPVAQFAIRPATTSNIANTIDRNSQAIKGDSGVTLGTGWQGPYLQLPIGANELKDAWGHSMVTYANDINEYSHLRGANDTDIAANNLEVYGLRTLGKDDLLGGVQYDADMPLQLTHNTPRLHGTISGTVTVGTALAATETQVVVQFYCPDRDSGLIRVERATIESKTTNSTTNEDVFSFRFRDASQPTGDSLFPIGVRAIRAYVETSPDTSADFSDGIGDPKKSPVVHTTVLPTTNTVSLRVDS